MTAARVAIAIWMLWPDVAQGPAVNPWMDKFEVRKADLRTRGRNLYLILEPGYQLVLEGPEGRRLVVAVLNDTVAAWSRPAAFAAEGGRRAVACTNTSRSVSC